MQAIFNWRTSYDASAATPVRANSSDLPEPEWGHADLHSITTVDDLEFVNRAEVQVPAGESAYQYPDILAQYTSKQLNAWPALHRDVPSILKHEHIPELQFTDCRLPNGCLPQLLQERACNEAVRVSILSSTRKEPMRWVELVRDALMPCSVGVLLAVLLIGGGVHQAVHLGGVRQLHLEHPPVCEGVAVDLQAQEIHK